MEDEIKKLQEQLASAEANFSALQSVKDGLDNEIAEYKAEAGHEIAKLAAQVTERDASIESMKAEIASQQKQLDGLQSEGIVALKAELETVKADNETKAARIAELDALVTPPGISTMDMAIKHFKDNYSPGETVKRVLVTQDGQVFYDDEISGGRVHAADKKLLHFTFNNF